MNIQDFIKPELLVLIPVLYFIGTAIKKSAVKDKYIPIILGGVSVVLSALWIVSTSDITNGKEAATAVFTAITQGILLAGTSVYANQILKQSKEDTKNE